MSETLAAPRDFATLRAEIVARHAALPKRLAQIATFAVNHPDEIAFGTAASIAARAEVQPSTLIRFAQAMGYNGFTELQAIFRQHLRDRIPNYEKRLKALAGSASKLGILFDTFCAASERSIEVLRKGTHVGQLEKGVEILAGARTIYLIGIRRSFPIVSYMAYAFGKLGVRYVLIDSIGGLAAEATASADADDAIFAMSFTPYATETVTLAGQAAERGVPIVAVTDSPFSPLAQSAKIWFEVVETDVEGFRSLAASFALALTLTVAVAERRRGN